MLKSSVVETAELSVTWIMRKWEWNGIAKVAAKKAAQCWTSVLVGLTPLKDGSGLMVVEMQSIFPVHCPPMFFSSFGEHESAKEGPHSGGFRESRHE